MKGNFFYEIRSMLTWCQLYFCPSKKREKKGKTRLFDALDPLKHILLVAYVKKVVSPLRVEDPEGKWPIRNAPRVKRDL